MFYKINSFKFVILAINLCASLLFYFNQNYFDAALFKLQLQLPQLGNKPYIDFEFYYPFFYVALSKYVGLDNVFLGFILYLFNFGLSIFALKMSESNVQKFAVSIFLVLQPIFFGILGTEPLSLIILFNVFLLFNKSGVKHKILLIILFSILLAMRWDRAVFLFAIILLYSIIIFVNNIRGDVLKFPGGIVLCFAVSCVINIIFIGCVLDVDLLEYLRLTIMVPSIISNNRSMPNISSMFSMMMIFVTSVACFLCIRLAYLNIGKNLLIIYLMPFALLPYAAMRPDWAHLVPFLLLSIIPIVLSYVRTITNIMYLSLAVVAGAGLMVGALFVGKVRMSLLECQAEIRKFNAQSLYVTDSKFTSNSINYPIFYHLNPKLFLVSKYISDEPGIRELENVKISIERDFDAAAKPLLLVAVNGPLESEHYLSKYIFDKDAYKMCRVKDRQIVIYEIN